jgi:TadE-like protein
MTIDPTSANSRREHALRKERGASAVEFAIILPVLMFLLMGILEFGLLLKNLSIVTNAASAGGRAGSVESRVSGYYDSAERAVDAILRNNGLHADWIVIYKANKTTGQPWNSAGTWTGSTDFETCTANCIKYQLNTAGTGYDLIGTSGTPNPNWLSSTQAACGPEASTDYLGVYVKYTHRYVTSLFGSSRTVREKAVYRLEPIPPSAGQSCQ